eukprot:7208842-Prymnesium_polylepis.1
MLRSFLEERGERYSDELSSPLTGWDSCSRLSAHLSWGHVSLRHVFQQLSARQDELRQAKRSGDDTGGWLKSLAALGSRLRWRSHFSQKLHDQPSIEHKNMVAACEPAPPKLAHAGAAHRDCVPPGEMRCARLRCRRLPSARL